MLRIRWCSSAIVFVVGCGDAAPGGAPDGGSLPAGDAGAMTTPDSGPGVVPGTDAGAAIPSGACDAAASFALGETTYDLVVGELDRQYIVHVPPGYTPGPTPVVLAFNGRTSSPESLMEQTDLSAKSDEAGFVLVYPRGSYDGSWNADGCCGEPNQRDVDDVGFVRALLDDLESHVCVDRARVFATGLSNGGFMSHRLACELSDRIAAVAPVAGVNLVEECTPARAVSIIHFHGTLDFLVPYGGNPILSFPSVDDSTQGWIERGGCAPDGETVFEMGDSTCVAYSGCRDGAVIELCTVQNGGHTWPGGNVTPAGGITTRDLIANDAMWDFFLAHPMR
jgi:polyhydroxybutyrate depolymerase